MEPLEASVLKDDPVEALYERFGSMVYRRCLSMLGDEEDAIDAMQDVFVKVLEMDVDIHSPSSLLYIVATRTCLNRIRSRSRRRDSPDSELLERIATIPDTAGVSRARFVLGRLFGSNPESSQVIAVLHYLDGLTLKETAEEVGMSVSGVRRRLRVLRAELRDLEATT